MNLEIRHYGIVVQDLNEALNFYVGLLNFKLISIEQLSGEICSGLLDLSCGITCYKLQLTPQEPLLELYVLKDTWREPSIRSLNHIAITVENISECFNIIKNKNLLVSNEIYEISGYQLFFGKDPDGNRVEFVERIK